MIDTIFALSSGSPPAAIGVIRISGPGAGAALESLAGRALPERRAVFSSLRSTSGALLDEALVLWLPGPNTATGEDLAELHCHGGRAVVSAVERELTGLAGLRPAEAGEFTKRAFQNGRIDLSEAEGLADLLSAETEFQRAAAIAMVEGSVSRETSAWRDEVLRLSAFVESALDFSDEDDVGDLPDHFRGAVRVLVGKLSAWLDRPKAEKLKDGFRVVVAGPPNTGKSSLFNALTQSEAAITSPVAGTTRDFIERSVAIEGIPFSFVDTAGLRQSSSDEIEMMGVGRAHDQMSKADLILWLGAEGEGPLGAWEISSMSDRDDFVAKTSGVAEVSAISGAGVRELSSDLVTAAKRALPKPGEVALSQRQWRLIAEAKSALEALGGQSDLLLVGEELRRARAAFDQLIGHSATEDMLDTLFGRFCIGK